MYNYYEILGVSRNAGQKEIKAAFKKLAVKYHPDKTRNDPDDENVFKKVNEAYQVLSDPEKKRQYDRRLEYEYFFSRNSSYNATRVRNYSHKTKTGFDFESHGQHYQKKTYYEPRGRTATDYFVAFIFMTLVGIGFLIFGFFMNKYSAKQEYKKAEAAFEQNNYYEAMKQLNNALMHHDEFGKAYLKRGMLYLKMGNNYKALHDLQNAEKYLKDQEKNAQLYFLKGMGYKMTRQYDSAIVNLQKSIEYNSADTVFITLGELYAYKKNNFNKAQTFFSRAIQNGNDSYNAYFGRGFVHLHLANHYQAIQDLNRAAKKMPANGKTYHFRGRALLNYGRQQAACNDFYKADSLNYHKSRSFIYKYCRGS